MKYHQELFKINATALHSLPIHSRSNGITTHTQPIFKWFVYIAAWISNWFLRLGNTKKPSTQSISKITAWTTNVCHCNKTHLQLWFIWKSLISSFSSRRLRTTKCVDTFPFRFVYICFYEVFVLYGYHLASPFRV